MASDNKDFQSIINENRAKKNAVSWAGSCLEYLELVKANPAIAMSAPSRLYNMIIAQGTKPTPPPVASHTAGPSCQNCLRPRLGAVGASAGMRAC